VKPAAVLIAAFKIKALGAVASLKAGIGGLEVGVALGYGKPTDA
jgi:hypothetical protein